MNQTFSRSHFVDFVIGCTLMTKIFVIFCTNVHNPLGYKI